MDFGRSKANPTPRHQAHRSAGSDRASREAEPTIGDASRSDLARLTFRAHSTDGMGDDWPITYEELAPYYDKVESYIGVFGSKENIPNSPDGVFHATAQAALH